MSSSLSNIFPLRKYTFDSFFSPEYVLGSIKIFGPLVVIFVLFVLMILAFLSIAIFKHFFLRKKTVPKADKVFIPGNESIHGSVAKGSNNKRDAVSELKKEEEKEKAEEELFRDKLVETIENTLGDVTKKHKWFFAFDNIVAKTNNHERNMRSLHSILVTPIDYNLAGFQDSNPDIESDQARMAVAIRRRQQLAQLGIVPLTVPSNGDAKSGNWCSNVRMLAMKLQAMNTDDALLNSQLMDNSGLLGADELQSSPSISLALNDVADGENLADDNQNFLGTLANLVYMNNHASIADPVYTGNLKRW